MCIITIYKGHDLTCECVNESFCSDLAVFTYIIAFHIFILLCLFGELWLLQSEGRAGSN